MRICRFEPNRLGVVEGDQIADVTDALSVLPSHSYPFPGHDLLIANLTAVRARINQLLPTAHRARVGQAGISGRQPREDRQCTDQLSGAH